MNTASFAAKHSRRTTCAAGRSRFLSMLSLAVAIAGPGSLHASTASAQATAAPYTTGYRFDGLRRLVGEISADPSAPGNPLPFMATRYTYDVDGRLVKTEKGTLSTWQSDTVAPSAWTGFVALETTTDVYDNNDDKIEELVYGSDGSPQRVTQMSYTGDDHLQCTAVRMNPAAFGSLPSSACVQGTQGSQGPDRITINVYDAANQVVQVRKGVGTSSEQAYATYSYTVDGKQEYVIDANGNRNRLVWDSFDRQAQWQFPNSTQSTGFDSTSQASALATAGAVSATDFEQYGYDANGNRVSLRKRDGRMITFNFDNLNRLTSKTFGGGACVSGFACNAPPAGSVRDVYYSYNLRGLQTSARFDSASGADSVVSQYDGFGRQISSTVSMAGVSRTIFRSYDGDGNRTSVTHPDGTYFSYGYDGVNRLIGIKENGTTQVAANIYAAVGLPASSARGAVLTTYTYDPISRMAVMSDDMAGSSGDLTTTFGYNAADQISSLARSNDSYVFTGFAPAMTSYTANGLNQYTGVGLGALGYDANGNLSANGGTTFTYDVENRLVAATGTLSTNMVYDPLGRLYQTANGTITRQFLYDGDARVSEFDGSNGALLRRYVHGDDEDTPLLWYEGSGLSDRRSLQADQEGSIVSAADAAGDLLAIKAYDEYGVPSGGDVGAFQYTGQTYLPDLGMYNYKARIYSSHLGRFLQTDPVGFKDQMNLYGYVGDDPLNKRDPSGKCIEDLCIGEAMVLFEVAGYALDAIEAAGATETTLAAARGGVAVVASARFMQKSDLLAGISGVLRRNMAWAGQITRAGEDAHHIVPQGAQNAAATAARAVLQRANIGIHDAINGVALPSAFHATVHEKAYYASVAARLEAAEKAGGASAVRAVLNQIAAELRAQAAAAAKAATSK